MKKILLSALALTTIFTACDKNDDDYMGTGGGLAENQWKINGTSYAASQVNVTTTGGVIVGTDANGNTFTVTFGNDIPSESGSFKIVAPIDADEAGEVTVKAAIINNTPAVYTSMTSGQNATVTVTNGKISVTIPQITAKNPLNSETVNISGNLTQP